MGRSLCPALPPLSISSLSSIPAAFLVSPFCLFSLSRLLFSRDALKLLVFLLLLLLRPARHLSKLLWTMHPGWSGLLSFHRPSSLCLRPFFLGPYLHLFIQKTGKGGGGGVGGEEEDEREIKTTRRIKKWRKWVLKEQKTLTYCPYSCDLLLKGGWVVFSFRCPVKSRRSLKVQCVKYILCMVSFSYPRIVSHMCKSSHGAGVLLLVSSSWSHLIQEVCHRLPQIKTALSGRLH